MGKKIFWAFRLLMKCWPNFYGKRSNKFGFFVDVSVKVKMEKIPILFLNVRHRKLSTKQEMTHGEFFMLFCQHHPAAHWIFCSAYVIIFTTYVLFRVLRFWTLDCILKEEENCMMKKTLEASKNLTKIFRNKK